MRRLLSALVLAFASMSFSPAQAGGLLQDLFAPAPRAPAVMYYAPQQPQMRFIYDEGLRVSRRATAPRKAIAKKQQVKRWAVSRKGAVSTAGLPAVRSRIAGERRGHRLHATTGKKNAAIVITAAAAIPFVAAKPVEPAHIDNDPTLRVGDAYMTPEGLRIYRGPEARAKQRKVFVDFRRSSLGSGVKSQLAALEGAAQAAAIQRVSSPPLKASPAGASTRKSVDREGRVIRVVGP